MEKVFVYGTLRDKKIRFRVTGREIAEGEKDFISGYSLSIVTDEGMCYPIIVEAPLSEERIEGELIEVTSEELFHLDNYEGDLYRRIEVTTTGGKQAWVYCK